MPDWLRENLPMFIATGSLIAFFWRFFDKKFERIDRQFERIDGQFDRVYDELKDIRNDLWDIKERVTFLEAQTIMFNAVPDVNVRSEAAKKTWERRKAKQLANLNKKKEK